jgi:hypothetical protein
MQARHFYPFTLSRGGVDAHERKKRIALNKKVMYIVYNYLYW